MRALSIIDINKINYKKVHQAFKKVGSINFKKKLLKTKNPYYKKDTSKNIVRILEKINLDGITTKEFMDLNKNEFNFKKYFLVQKLCNNVN